jgi:phage-related protein
MVVLVEEVRMEFLEELELLVKEMMEEIKITGIDAAITMAVAVAVVVPALLEQIQLERFHQREE